MHVLALSTGSVMSFSLELFGQWTIERGVGATDCSGRG